MEREKDLLCGDETMKKWTEKISFDFSDKIANETFTEDSLFFDIETTGFSPVYSTLYLIGCAHRVGNDFVITQYFAETVSEESEILSCFLQELVPYRTVISFNGLGFDIPFLKAKCLTYNLSHSFESKEYLDIYKEVSKLKKILKLPNYKQKTMEHFLGIARDDTFSGGELIDVYKEYLKNPDDASVLLLKRHNYEDVLGMTGLIPVRSYLKLVQGCFKIHSVESNIYKDIHGCLQKELIITLRNEYSIPKRVSCHLNEFYFISNGFESKLRIQLFEGTLKFFFEHPEEYYYLPAEDMAIHKSVASYVEKKYRRKANTSNCYIKKDAIFVPQYETLITPFFREKPKSKPTYFELTKDFLDSNDLLWQYVCHVFRLLLAR